LKVLVTGATGYLGAVAAHLRARLMMAANAVEESRRPRCYVGRE
jgi:thioester reductase-like protein